MGRLCTAAVMCAAAACVSSPETAMTQLLESRRLTSDLLVQFTKAADASNRAVMADTDEASTTFAREAQQASEAVRKDAGQLAPIVNSLGFADETRLLDEFNQRYAEYHKLDGEILSLAIENTNLKAQRLSFGPANDAVESFQHSLDAAVAADQTKGSWQLQTLAAKAALSVRRIQVLQGPHIAESNDAAMTQMEKRMAALEAEARDALHTMKGLVAPAPQQQVAAANAALDQFLKLNSEIVALSRRNTNVRSLALALGQKRTLSASCEEELRALQDALGKREFKATR